MFTTWSINVRMQCAAVQSHAVFSLLGDHRGWESHRMEETRFQNHFLKLSVLPISNTCFGLYVNILRWLKPLRFEGLFVIATSIVLTNMVSSHISLHYNIQNLPSGQKSLYTSFPHPCLDVLCLEYSQLFSSYCKLCSSLRSRLSPVSLVKPSYMIHPSRDTQYSFTHLPSFIHSLIDLMCFLSTFASLRNYVKYSEEDKF